MGLRQHAAEKPAAAGLSVMILPSSLFCSAGAGGQCRGLPASDDCVHDLSIDGSTDLAEI